MSPLFIYTTDSSKPSVSAWGSITGTLSQQTDLRDSLSEKASSAHSHSASDVTGTAVVTGDSRLSDARTPTNHDNTAHSGAFLVSTDVTSKCGIATKNVNDASTTQTIAHGLGRVPKIVRVSAVLVYTAAISMKSSGVYDGTNHSGICIVWTEGTTTATTDTVYSSTSAELGFTALGSTNPYTGANRQTGVITVNSTNITITWTKAGTVASATANILWEVN
jgi:hypothetical protein